MANSNIIDSLKQRVIKEIAYDETFFHAINPDTSEVENGGDLPNTHIFTYNRNPETITEVMTFLTIMVDTYSRDRNKTFITPTLTIWIYSHNNHMKVTNVNGVKCNRNDYIAKLLDERFNGTSEAIGTLRLVSNVEGVAGKEFLCRKMVFETIDLNNSLCESW